MSETKEKKVKLPVFDNVKPQDASIMQVTQCANPVGVKADNDGTVRITQEAKKGEKK